MKMPKREDWQKVLSPNVDEFIASKQMGLRYDGLGVEEQFREILSHFNKMSADEKAEYLLWILVMSYVSMPPGGNGRFG